MKIKTPSKKILDYIKTNFRYDPETGVVERHRKPDWWRPVGAIVAVDAFGYRQNMMRHQIAWYLTMGQWPDKFIDHCDGNDDNNKFVNLRLATSAENAANTRKKANASGTYKGVSWSKKGKRWLAVINLNGKTKVLGRFLSEIEAAYAYDKGAVEAFGAFARCNFIGDHCLFPSQPVKEPIPKSTMALGASLYDAFWGRVNKNGATMPHMKSQCWEWIGRISSYGYGQLYSVMEDRYVPAHRVSYILNIGTISANMCICHACDNRKCVNPDHLWMGTNADNVRDREAKGRGKRGRQKLTEMEVLEIRFKWLSGLTCKEIGAQYNVDKGTVQSACSGHSWKNVPMPQGPRHKKHWQQ